MDDARGRDPARCLLFGLLAFQNSFVDRDELLAAYEAWMNDRTRPLGSVLVDRGSISDDLHGLIAGLVAAHLAKHGHRPEKSLAALSPLGDLREDLEALADADLTQSLAVLTTRPRAVEEADGTIRISVGVPSSRGTRFQVLRALSRGGMGVVSVALDSELDRTIALKEIREGAADNQEYRARFLAEAEITGKLEHPGIIPIYGLGTYADGRPFYAMRLIRGEKTGSLMDAIERFHREPDPEGRVVEFQGLLRRFLDVCNALDYAHSKGVLHRDLKPDNILLGPYGETLVVDWGLAKAAGLAEPGVGEESEQVRLKLSGSAVTPTRAGSAFGTPEYAPPEQMIGDLPSVGPRSDVYGLGAVLYSVMTGRAPFSRRGVDIVTLIRQVEHGEFPPPRQVRPGLDKALEAICLKAMRTRPDERYESVRSLAADLENYLAEEPVSAYLEPWTVRARRWAKRHRTLVTSSAAALLVALVGLAGITAVQTKARNDLAVKNGELERANTSLDEQRKRAEDREGQAIVAVRRFGDAISKNASLKDNPALDSLRKDLLKQPIGFFKTLRDRLQADRDTRPESLHRLGGAAFDLAYLTSEIGDREDSLAGYRESLSIFRKLADAHPRVADYRSDLGLAHNNVGLQLHDTGRTAEALSELEAALAVRQELADAHPEVDGYQGDLASSYNNLGVTLKDIGRPAETMKAYRAALAIRQKLADAHPDDPEHLDNLAGSHNNIGNLLSETGEPAASLKELESALAIRQKLADAHPDVAKYQSDVAAGHNNIGNRLRDSGETVKALAAHESALAIYRKLADAHPSMTRFQNNVADARHNIGLLLGDSDPAASLKSHESALAIYRKLADANPSVTQFQNSLAVSHKNVGDRLDDLGKQDEAIRAYESALAIQEKLAREHPESPEFSAIMGAILNNQANIDLRAQRFESARDRLRRAVEWQRKAVAAFPAHPTYRRFLGGSLFNLIRANKGLGDAEGVAEAERQLAKFRESDPELIALDARLAAVIRGDQAPKDDSDRLELADRAYEKALHAASARLYAEALTNDPKLAEIRKPEHRYNAACAAALAGSGRGKDDPPPDDAARGKFRRQALEWLNAELTFWKALASKGDPGDRETVAKTLEHWKGDADLAHVRDPTALARLPEAERAAFQGLWKDVDGLLSGVR
jgi:serine/threonine protein kinase/tetratricopeptide (TPR) repeat protein